MQRRYQVLLPDWLEDYIKIGVETYGFSFSEIIRLQLCFSILAQIPVLHPEYTPNVTIDEILEAIKSASTELVDKKSFNRFASQINFEARKAIEFREKKMEGLSTS